MVRRSVLFAPGDQPELMRKAPETGADTVVFDLEDAVAPDRMDEAREAVAAALEALDGDTELCVRVNPLGQGGGADLDALNRAPDSVMLPKVSGVGDVEALARALEARGLEVPVLALLETAAGVLAAAEVAGAAVTDAVLFGAEDLAADLGATRTDEGTEVLHARQRVALAAAGADIDAIDTLYTEYEDTEGLAVDTERAREWGFDGKMAIHPTQVPVINDAFTPDPERVEWAERVVAASQDNEGVFAVDGEMIDAPLIAQAETVLERARAAREE